MQGTLSPIASTILAIAALEIATEFSLNDPYTPALPVGLYVLGLGLGPLVLAPCSELYGRRIVYLLCFLCFAILSIGCALSPNITALCILRLLSGMMGSAGPSLGASSIGDMFSHEERGRAQAVYAFGPTCGPVLGGVLGGFITYHTAGWRWLMWVMAIASGVVFILCAIFLRETYGPYLCSQKQKRSQTIVRLHERLSSTESRRLFKRSIALPLRLLFTSPICMFLSIYLSL
jgi:multidrug resistance protein